MTAVGRAQVASAPAWFALQTRSRHEKRVEADLGRLGVERFLPLVPQRRRWSDRVQVVEAVLFPCYLFVRLRSDERLAALRPQGVVRMVGSGTSPSPVGDAFVEELRRICASGLDVEPFPWLSKGDHVRIRSGPLRGLEGTFVEARGKHYVVVTVDLLQRAAGVVVDLADVEACA